MNVIYVPKSAKDFNHKLSVGENVSRLMSLGRKVGTYQRLQRPVICNECGYLKQCQLHHVQPIWYLALKCLLSREPQDEIDLGRIMTDLWRHYDFGQWHDGNLIPLCADCHRSTHIETDRQLKKQLEDEYPVVFGFRRPDDVQALINANLSTG
jgi:hypothetical protein